MGGRRLVEQTAFTLFGKTKQFDSGELSHSGMGLALFAKENIASA
jgi:hypothetical protein